NAEIQAVDMSPEALEVARENACRLRYEARVLFSQGDLLSGFVDQGEYFDVVVSNPPYVGEDEPEKVQREVREHEPRLAVFSGRTGMEVYERLIPQAESVLKPGGWLVMEIGYSIEQRVRDLLAGWNEIHAKPDLQGIPRVMIAKKGP